MRNIKLQILSLLFIVAFIQKLGMQLWIHESLHHRTTSNHFSQKDAQVQMHCYCWDDIQSPQEAVSAINIPLLTTEVHTEYVQPGFIYIKLSPVLSSLRGPPAI